MAAVLRLARAGAKKAPIYHVVAADRRAPRDGRFIEKLGVFNPNRDPEELKLDLERIEYWLGVGAKPTERVEQLIRRARKAASAPAPAEG